jgi:glycosyltransferase involved in cell wall biosynthesis
VQPSTSGRQLNRFSSSIAIDARRSRTNPTTGTGIYAHGLAEGLSELDSLLGFWVIENTPLMRLRESRIAIRPVQRFARLLSDCIEIPLITHRSELRHSLYPECIVAKPFVSTIHDLDVVLSPRRSIWTDYYTRFTAHALEHAEHVIVPSGFTLRQVCEFTDRKQRVAVIPLGVDWSVADSANHGEGDYFFYSGGFHQRKNVDSLLTGFCDARRRGLKSRLVMTGNPPMPLPEGVVSTGEIRRAEYWDLLKSSLGLVYPSTYEGFGFPIVEAMGVGKPVISARVGVVGDLDEGATLRINTSEPLEISRALFEIERGNFESTASSDSIRERFNWRECALRTSEIYERYV